MTSGHTAAAEEMETPVRVLHVEDDPADREHVRRVLSRVGGFQVVEATRVKDFEHLLSEGEWDCVLTDIQLSGYTGLDVLDRVNAMHLGLPVVFLAGGGSEEVAVEAMKRGAADYILKTATHYEKLPLVLRNAVAANREREARARTQKVLEKSEAAYRQLFHTNPHPMWIYDLSTLAILEVNESAIRKYGWTREEFLGMSIRDMRPPEDVPLLMRFLEETPGEATEGRLWRHIKKSGEMLYVEASSHPLEWEGHRAKMVLVTDVTERVQVEEEMRETLAELNTLHHAAPVGIALVSSRTLLRGNQVFSDISGYSREDLMMLPAEKLFGSESDARRFFDVLEPQLASAGQVSLDRQIRCRDGSERWVRITARGIDREEPWKGEVWVVEDLELSRMAEAALGHMAEDLAEAQRVGHLGSWSRSFTTGEVVYSAEQYRLLGLEPSSPTPRTVEDFLKLVHPDDREATAQAYRRLRETGEPVDVEFRVPLPEGGERWVHAAMRGERDAAGRVVRAYGINQDVTEVRKAQERVRRSRDFYASLLDNFPILTWHTDTQHRCNYVNRGWTEFTGLPLQAAYDKGWTELIHPDDRQVVLGIIQAAVVERRPFNHEYRLLHADGTHHWVRDVGGPIFDLAGEFAGFAGGVLDLEDRRRAEVALREKEERFRTLINESPDFIAIMDHGAFLKFVSPSVRSMLGYEPQAVLGRSTFEFVHPEDVARAQTVFAELLPKTGEGRRLQLRVLNADGGSRDVDVVARNLFDVPAIGGILVSARTLAGRAAR